MQHHKGFFALLQLIIDRNVKDLQDETATFLLRERKQPLEKIFLWTRHDVSNRQNPN